jgi:hypothetical protein
MAKKCELWKKGGERCNADAQTGKRVCVFHDPNKASDGRRARRAGGITRSRAATVLQLDTPDHPLGDTNQVSVLLADSINRLRRGQLDPRVANAMGYLASVLLKALENGRIEDWLAHLEAVLTRRKETETEAFDFRPAMGTNHEGSSTTSEGD